MRYYHCQCGYCEAWGSDPPARCSFCSKCGTSLGGNGHYPDALPHDFSCVTDVNTDEGEKILTLCKYCYRSKREIEKLDGLAKS